jgi:hypothetical protein
VSKNDKSHSDYYKTPKALFSPHEDKKPRFGATPSENGRVEFRSEQMDMLGPWGWSNFDVLKIQELLKRIFEFQKFTLQELRNTHSHLVDVAELDPKAQKRLKEIKKDDLDQLYSLRLSGRERMWAIKDGNLLWLLWWDPHHEVCPSYKKHT